MVRAWLTGSVSADGQPAQPTIGRIRELLAASWERASEVTGGSLGRADDVLNRAVDRAVAARFEVPDAEAVKNALEKKESVESSVASSKAVMAIVAGLLARFGALKRIPALAGRSNAWLAGAMVAGTRARVAVGRGLREVQVLASYLAGRAARDGVELDDRLLRAITVAVYVDPTKKVDLRYRGKRAGAALAGQWTANALRSGPAPASVVHSWVSAIDDLRLVELKAEWERVLSD
jgi:hypothetical protein